MLHDMRNFSWLNHTWLFPVNYSLRGYKSHSILLSFSSSTIGNMNNIDTVPSTIPVTSCHRWLSPGLYELTWYKLKPIQIARPDDTLDSFWQALGESQVIQYLINKLEKKFSHTSDSDFIKRTLFSLNPSRPSERLLANRR